MDNTDLRILNLLTGNARMSFQEIGNAVSAGLKQPLRVGEKQPILAG